MDLVVRPAEPHELRDVADAMRIALLFPRVGNDEWEKWKVGWESGHLAIGAWDGDTCVGHAGALHFDTCVPGGAWVPTAGVTRVGVLPTHARRGALSRMMRRLMDDERANGKVLASLRASEAVIYSRFGFGLAGEALGVRVHPHRIDTVQGAAAGSMRILSPEEFDTVLPELYARVDHRAGAISRSPFFWTRILKEANEGGKATFVAVHSTADGVDDGYVLYSVDWGDAALSENLGHGVIHDLFGDTRAAELALWQYMVGISLLRSIEAGGRPVDDLLPLAIADVRAYEVKQRWDEQWIRLLDVEAALSARTYRDAAPVTVSVDDPWYPENSATFRIGPAGVTRTTDPAELIAPIEAISAAYMGAVPWSDLLAVGRVSGDPQAVARADRLFAHRPTTWSATFF